MKKAGGKTRTKNPGTAAFLSILVWPGSGNIYNEKFRHGFIWISTAVAGWMLYIVQLGVFATVLVSIYLFAALHAYRQARKINVFRTGSPQHVPGERTSVGAEVPTHNLSEGRKNYARSKR